MSEQKKRHRWKLLRRAPNEYRCMDCGYITLEHVRVPPCDAPTRPSNKKTDTGDRK